MLLSMTGYGRASRTLNDKTITVEIRALNSKVTDMRLKLPLDFKEREVALRKIVTEKGERGKIDVVITLDNIGENNGSNINKDLFTRYYRELKAMAEELGMPPANYTEAILRIPSVVNADLPVLDEEEWDHIETTVLAAFEQFNQFRAAEGAALEEDLRLRTQTILDLLREVAPFEEERITRMRQRLHQQMEEFWGRENVDENRYEQEILFYLEKMDITEEKVRLEQHCRYFFEQLDAQVVSKGRQLGFISQEMGREINTLGAKAYSSDIQHLVVKMKDELEKIKEQLANAV